jgi:pSer/pThr/pTyr-binding forkhead associated (FHA) protein
MCGHADHSASIGAAFTGGAVERHASHGRDERMKLTFPGGEHPHVELDPGVQRIGSDPASHIVLGVPGVQPLHCELHVSDKGVMVQVPGDASVNVNGRPVAGLIALRNGDHLDFHHVHAKLIAIEATDRLPATANDDPAATAVRVAVPRYFLRGLDKDGRSHPVAAPTLVGRARDCQLRLDDDGLSRRHARLLPTPEGLQVEDLGSTNGTTVNGRRIERAMTRAGDEIAFDALRFRVVAPGMSEPLPETAPPASRSWVGWSSLALLAVALATAWWWLG